MVELSLGRTFSGPYKADLPESVLRNLIDSDGLGDGPLIFALRHSDTAINIGVREFSTHEGELSLSSLAAQKLGIKEGDIVQVSRAHIPRGTQITLKPEQSAGSIDWKSLLESWLPKNYTALSLGDRIIVPYLDKDHELVVTHLEPDNESVCVVDTDMDLVIESEAGNDTATVSSEPIKLELNTTLDLPTETLLISEGLSVESIYVSCSELAYIGPEHATSSLSFIAVADSEPKQVSTALLGSKFCIRASGRLTVSTEAPALSSDPQCEFCGKHIPEQSYVLHTSFCRRNSVQCPECSRRFGGTSEVPDAHRTLHTLSSAGGGECACGEFQSDNLASLAFHRATTCSLRPHICQFCHLLVPQGDTSPVDAALGLTGHESQCGNRTTDCPLCNRPIRLRSLGLHLKEHDERRKERQPPVMCANQNCPSPLSAPSISGLCSACFGPLSVPGKNSDLQRIRKSMERRYLLQMTEGCKRSYCQNPYCATNRKRTFSEAAKEAHEILEHGEGKQWFCVDEARTRKAMFVALEGEYARGWRGLAISTCASESEAQQWLQVNANKLNEN